MLGLLLAHHTQSYLGIEIEVNGHTYPDGMMDHAIFFGVGLLILILTVYGLVALIRDLVHWRRRRRAGQLLGGK